MNGHCGDHDNCFDRMDRKLDTIINRLGDGDVSLAQIFTRIKILEMIVYGGVGAVLFVVLMGGIAAAALMLPEVTGGLK